jgi:hypothetical protein
MRPLPEDDIGNVTQKVGRLCCPPVGHGTIFGWLVRYRRLVRDYER